MIDPRKLKEGTVLICETNPFCDYLFHGFAAGEMTLTPLYKVFVAGNVDTGRRIPGRKRKLPLLSHLRQNFFTKNTDKQ